MLSRAGNHHKMAAETLLKSSSLYIAYSQKPKLCLETSCDLHSGLTYIVNGKNEKCASTCNLCNNSHKLGIGSTEVGVMCVLCDLNVLIAAFTFSWAPINVTELGAPHSTPPQLIKRNIINGTMPKIVFCLAYVTANTTSSYAFKHMIYKMHFIYIQHIIKNVFHWIRFITCQICNICNMQYQPQCQLPSLCTYMSTVPSLCYEQ